MPRNNLLKDSGIFAGASVGTPFWALLAWVAGGKRVLMTRPPEVRSVLGRLCRLLEDGRFNPVIDRTYPLDEIVDAFRYVGSGQKVGNVVISITP